MSIIFLDDDKARIKIFKRAIIGIASKVAKTTEQCINLIQEMEEVNILFLDHDLGGETYVDSAREDCGMEVVRWIIEHDPFVKQIIIHSHNTQAAEDMVEALRKAQYHASHIPFYLMVQRIGELSDGI